MNNKSLIYFMNYFSIKLLISSNIRPQLLMDLALKCQSKVGFEYPTLTEIIQKVNIICWKL
jgi:hypothetical protein